MNTTKRSWLYLLLIPLCLLMADQTLGQRIYNKEKDDQAQEAKKIAGEIASTPVFDKQLKNLKLISQQDFATYFMGAKRKMDLEINAFDRWRAVGRAVQSARNQVTEPDPYPNESLDQIRAKLKAEREAATTKLKELKAKVTPSEDEAVPVALERLNNLESLLGFADDLLTRSEAASTGQKELLSGVKEIEQTVTAIKELYGSYLSKMDDIDAKSRELEGLKIPMQKVAIARLQVEEQHWKNVGAIQARRAAEQADLLLLFSEFEEGIKRLGLASSIDELARAGEEKTIELTIDQIISAGEEHKFNQPTQEVLRAASVKTRETAAVVNTAKNAWEQARLSRDQRRIKKANLDLIRANSQLYQAQEEEKELRQAITKTKTEIIKLRKRLASTLDVLYVAAAISAHASTPANLAALRLAQEEHRYSIRKSAVLAQAYEATVSSGAQRLAIYYKSGLKPEKIAQLIHTAATAAIPPAILAR